VTDPVAAVREAYAALWGPPSRIAEFHKGALTAEIRKWTADSNPEGVALYVTLGSSRYPVPGCDPSHRLEFILGLLPERDEVASALAALALYSQREGEPLDHGHTVPAEGPLWPGTTMDGFLVMRPISPLVQIINFDGMHIEVLQAIPTYKAERDLLREKPADELLADWQQEGVPFWDPERPPHA
jgi:hypothetical protein